MGSLIFVLAVLIVLAVLLRFMFSYVYCDDEDNLERFHGFPLYVFLLSGLFIQFVLIFLSAWIFF